MGTQDIIVAVAVALAALHVGRCMFSQLRGLLRSETGCSTDTSCSRCEYSKAPSSSVVPLSEIKIG